jgi:hypothetical protein
VRQAQGRGQDQDQEVSRGATREEAQGRGLNATRGARNRRRRMNRPPRARAARGRMFPERRRSSTGVPVPQRPVARRRQTTSAGTSAPIASAAVARRAYHLARRFTIPPRAPSPASPPASVEPTAATGTMRSRPPPPR